MMKPALLAVIDVGTVTARLALSRVCDGQVAVLKKISTIVNLGTGVDASGRLDPRACQRVIDCLSTYVTVAREAGATVCVCTLTSAARDASNANILLMALKDLGLRPQVIPGEVEGRLTFLGVAQDFPGTRLLVADNGGGSTELVYGVLNEGGLSVDLVRSTDVGCRRLTERFLSQSDPPSLEDMRCAHEFAASRFGAVVLELRERALIADRLVCTGGTVTSLVAIDQQLDPYDSSRVHLHTLTAEKVTSLEQRLSALTVAQRAHVTGVQPRRAPVIVAGTVAISELLTQTGFAELTVSESDLLVGMSLTLDTAYRAVPSPVEWVPAFTEL